MVAPVSVVFRTGDETMRGREGPPSTAWRTPPSPPQAEAPMEGSFTNSWSPKHRLGEGVRCPMSKAGEAVRGATISCKRHSRRMERGEQTIFGEVALVSRRRRVGAPEGRGVATMDRRRSEWVARGWWTWSWRRGGVSDGGVGVVPW